MGFNLETDHPAFADDDKIVFGLVVEVDKTAREDEALKYRARCDFAFLVFEKEAVDVTAGLIEDIEQDAFFDVGGRSLDPKASFDRMNPGNIVFKLGRVKGRAGIPRTPPPLSILTRL
jgi:hypothetical protein